MSKLTLQIVPERVSSIFIERSLLRLGSLVGSDALDDQYRSDRFGEFDEWIRFLHKPSTQNLSMSGQRRMVETSSRGLVGLLTAI